MKILDVEINIKPINEDEPLLFMKKYEEVYLKSILGNELFNVRRAAEQDTEDKIFSSIKKINAELKKDLEMIDSFESAVEKHKESSDFYEESYNKKIKNLCDLLLNIIHDSSFHAYFRNQASLFLIDMSWLPTKPFLMKK